MLLADGCRAGMAPEAEEDNLNFAASTYHAVGSPKHKVTPIQFDSCVVHAAGDFTAYYKSHDKHVQYGWQLHCHLAGRKRGFCMTACRFFHNRWLQAKLGCSHFLHKGILWSASHITYMPARNQCSLLSAHHLI